jgi:squalene synthase HpnC
LRAPIAAIYHFARTADDIADEGDATPQERLDTLHAYRQALLAANQPGNLADAQPPIPSEWLGTFAALQHAIATHQLPVQLLHDLLDAFVQDTEKSRDRAGYANEAELLDYCRRSANPVGRLLLHLYGVHSEEALLESDAICSALQLINFWQDPSVDIPRGRYYLPQDACAQFGLAWADMVACKQTDSATKLVASCAHSARTMMLNGSKLVHRIPGRAGWELRLVVQGGLRILDKVQALRGGSLHTRPRLRPWDWCVMLARAKAM